MRLFFLSLLVLCAGLLAGCKDATVGPDLTGSITGTVRADATNEPLANAQVTTSPPSSAPVTGENGQFSFDDVPTGNYTVTASRSDYQSRSVTIAVREGQTTDANLSLMLDDEDDQSSGASVDAQIVNSATRMEGDSALVDVEYRVRNTGGVDVAVYEVDFRIETDTEPFFVQESGQDLLSGQSDVGRFTKYTRENLANSVVIDTLTFEEAGSDGS